METISKRVFGFDIDGVLTNDDDGDCSIWLKEASNYFSEPILKRAYYIEEAFNKSEAEVQAFFKDRIITVFDNVPARNYTVETLSSIYKRGHTIHLITARDERHRQVTENWLQRHKIPYHSLRMSPPNESYSKGALCKELGVEFFVDDKIENAEDTSSMGVYTLLYHASHNRDYKTSLPIVKNWLEIQAHIELFLRNTTL